ncbi:hypothetical protein ACHAXR_010666 [Thalassiosira sp. AJA248-18]
MGQELPQPLEELFLTMQYRKMQRDLNGPQKKKTKYHFIALWCLLILVYGLSAGYNSNSTTSEEGDDSIIIALSFSQIIIIAVWIFVAIAITAILGGQSKFTLLLYWMVVYWPLLAILASLFINREERELIIVILLIIAECVTFLVFGFVYYIYPRFVTSKWFRENHARRFWKIKLLDDGVTMQYDGFWGRLGRRYECQYMGETNESGQPHGRGEWSDNSYHGEVMMGTWEDGRPVAPFSSRQYGTGDTFSAVRLLYFMATDDTFLANKLMPTNDNPPRCGTVSVECSIAGAFMSHLPCASLLDPSSLDEPQREDCMSVGKKCKHLDSGYSAENPMLTSLQINANDPRGVQVGGHLYAPTRMPFTKRINQIIIDVKRSNVDAEYQSVDDGSKEILADSEGIDSTHGVGHKMSLEVQNWSKIDTKDALIFIPGFNSWLKHSCETFGQMMAMTTLSKAVYPILFQFPGAQVLTYRKASQISASENNKKYFLQMLHSLKTEGFLNIHIVTHSLGVQTLMDCFENNSDGSPSPVSDCFGQAPANNDTSSSLANVGKLVCRSITLLNPDYPLYAFREHGFRSIRRVSSLITVVGDKTDQALFWSSLINGIVNRLGWSQPSALDSEARRNRKSFQLQAAIGKSIDSLHVNEGEDPDDWLDCDCIDTTGLDTNVNDLRHSAYSVNSILLRDIEEIVVTGKRAADRTTLLHRKGNVFEYCHAPSFVAQ